MMTAVLKLALLAGLAVATFGVIPNRRIGGILAIGICVAGAVVLHFAAP
ncbi:MAG TPA: hypothetical protein VGH70_16190 [Bradyrhizobium sp.]|jgi:hypothetical protein